MSSVAKVKFIAGFLFSRRRHACLEPCLTATLLRFANTLPPSGCVEDFHLQIVKHARHTKKGRTNWLGPLNRRRLESLRGTTFYGDAAGDVTS